MTNRERDALERQVMAGEGSNARIRDAWEQLAQDHFERLTDDLKHFTNACYGDTRLETGDYMARYHMIDLEDMKNYIREARDGLDYLTDIIRDEQVKRYGQYNNDL